MRGRGDAGAGDVILKLAADQISLELRSTQKQAVSEGVLTNPQRGFLKNEIKNLLKYSINGTE